MTNIPSMVPRSTWGIFGGFPKLGVPFWGSHSKDSSILGSMLGSPFLGKLPSALGDMGVLIFVEGVGSSGTTRNPKLTNH